MTPDPADAEGPGTLDPISLSVMIAALSGIAEEMGSLLVRGAYSANIKERRDCSAALFDRDGRMVAQAEHIPVHLGAMPYAVQAVLERAPEAGDVFVLNDPFHGGSHLPDVTMVSPIAQGDTIIGYAATRAHHADIGGMRPGSMPGNSVEIFQEGLIIPPVRLVRGGELNHDLLDVLLANVRAPAISRGDYQAQLAANGLAEARLSELTARFGQATVSRAFHDVIAYAERRTRDAIAALPDGTYAGRTEIEGDGTTPDDIAINVLVTIEGSQLHIDFAGTADAVPGNVNCPVAVTQAACYFAIRALIPNDIPANAGTFAAVSISIPPGAVLSAAHPSAVCAGNVETSSRVADALLMALAGAVDVPAAGQGTMNVLTIGGSRWSYLETLAGGQGASSSGVGPSGVHVTMTNTLNTPVEALEVAYPLRVERYELRYGSGGVGRHRGGDGLVRTIRVLEPCTVSLLTDRRGHRPAGADGGGDGAPGRNLLNGKELGAKTSQRLDRGDVVSIETPGGGGWGTPLDGSDPATTDLEV